MKKKLWIFAWSFLIIGIICLVFVQYQTKSIGGDAISGKIEGGQYYIQEAEGSYLRVSALQWYSNYIIWLVSIICTLVGFVLLGISLMVNWLPVLLKRNNRTFL